MWKRRGSEHPLEKEQKREHLMDFENEMEKRGEIGTGSDIRAL